MNQVVHQWFILTHLTHHYLIVFSCQISIVLPGFPPKPSWGIQTGNPPVTNQLHVFLECSDLTAGGCETFGERTSRSSWDRILHNIIQSSRDETEPNILWMKLCVVFGRQARLVSRTSLSVHLHDYLATSWLINGKINVLFYEISLSINIYIQSWETGPVG